MQIIAGHSGGNCKKTKEYKYIAGKKIEIGETFVEWPELTAPITTEDGRPGHKRTLQMLQKCQNCTKKIASKKKKIWSLMHFYLFYK